jgi:2-polyprenyl-3-methyl-5-hydroxy-6-metoxy-1,4-benzoquinol methylase
MSEIFKSRYIDKCLITGKPVTKVLDLGQHAYADTFIAEEQVGWSEPVFPLQVNLCEESGHLQLGYTSDAEERYNLYSYSYTSSNSAFSRTHWDEYAEEVESKFRPRNLVVEVGSNDGYLVGQFANNECNVLGVDLAKSMCDLAESRGVPTIQNAFSESVGRDILSKHGNADVVIANNVLNHANDPVDFVKGAAALIGTSGVFIFEMPYWLSMMESGRFVDQVYHEHISYFTMKSITAMLDQADLVAHDVKVVNYHGGSIRVCAKHKSVSAPSQHVSSFIHTETTRGYFTVEFYEKLMSKFVEERNNWLANFYRLKATKPDTVIIGIGAAAKANTWLTWHGLNKSDLLCVTDASEFKQGKYTPLSRIPITSDDVFADHSHPCALVLSWNIGERLKQSIQNINPNVLFITQ